MPKEWGLVGVKPRRMAGRDQPHHSKRECPSMVPLKRGVAKLSHGLLGGGNHTESKSRWLADGALSGAADWSRVPGAPASMAAKRAVTPEQMALPGAHMGCSDQRRRVGGESGGGGE